ncbi:MAG: DUF4440 domain-containing protein [Flavobacteriales bacterium]|nr:DUF4440 domain-containing protein [Flavobacteriales bacterium]
MRNIVLSLALLPMAPLAAQSPAEAEVLQVVDRFFATLADRDSSSMAGLLVPDGVMYAVLADEPGRPPLRVTHAEYLASLRQLKGRPVERYWSPAVQVDGSVATVWAPYDLHIDGDFSHCGHDVFTLVKAGDGWRIAGGVFSIRRKGCPQSPLGPVTR